MNHHNGDMKHIARVSILVAFIVAGVAGVTGCASKKPTAATPASAAPAATESMAAPSTDDSAKDSSAPTDAKSDPDDGGEVSPK